MPMSAGNQIIPLFKISSSTMPFDDRKFIRRLRKPLWRRSCTGAAFRNWLQSKKKKKSLFMQEQETREGFHRARGSEQGSSNRRETQCFFFLQRQPDEVSSLRFLSSALFRHATWHRRDSLTNCSIMYMYSTS